MKFCVYILSPPKRSGRRHALLLHSAANVHMAQLLAKSVRTIFHCPAWVQDYRQPADVESLAHRAWIEANRAELGLVVSA